MPLVRYCLRFRERSPSEDFSLLSPRVGYLGSAWRGAFGRELRKTLCVTGLSDCDACSLVRSCAYPMIFENRPPPDATKLTRYPRTPNPYVLEPADQRFDAQDGTTLNLGITLFGHRAAHLPYVIHALERAGARGLTRRRAALDLIDVQAERWDCDENAENPSWTTIDRSLDRSDRAPLARPVAPPIPSVVRVKLISPLRIKKGGHFVGATDFDFRAFAGNLLRRISLLTYFFGDSSLEVDFVELLRHTEQVPLSKANLRWHELTRHSSRQRTTMQMGGLVGSFEIPASTLGLIWPCLWLGQWTHIGKGCTMGLGRYILEPTSDNGETKSAAPLTGTG